MLDKGHIVADESPSELTGRFGRSNLEEVFLDIARRTEDAGGELARDTQA
jgi:ABC-2 type transport system ATP-binding protein